MTRGARKVRITGPGEYLTRGGRVAAIETQGPTGTWHGHIADYYTATWWKPDGSHNMFRSDDIVAVKEMR